MLSGPVVARPKDQGLLGASVEAELISPTQLWKKIRGYIQGRIDCYGKTVAPPLAKSSIRVCTRRRRILAPRLIMPPLPPQPPLPPEPPPKQPRMPRDKTYTMAVDRLKYRCARCTNPRFLRCGKCPFQWNGKTFIDRCRFYHTDEEQQEMPSKVAVEALVSVLMCGK